MPELISTAYSQWTTDAQVQVSLARVDAPAGEHEHAVVTLHVLRDCAPGWGHETIVEVLDIEGDGDGVEQWLRANADEVLASYARHLRAEYGPKEASWLLN